MPFAYRDKYGILHATEDKNTAKEYGIGKVVEYAGACLGGYPAITIEIIDYGSDKTYIGGNEKNGLELSKITGIFGDEARRLLKNIGI